MAKDQVRGVWEDFKLGLTQKQLDAVLDELEQYTGGDYDEVSCEFVMFLHGVAISMPYWCSHARRGAYKATKKSHHKRS